MQICFINYFVLSFKKTVSGPFEKYLLIQFSQKRYETPLPTGKSVSYHTVICFFLQQSQAQLL